MAKFLEGDNLNAAITNIFKEAKKELILISPFIKLYHRFKDELKGKKADPDLEIKIVFGKNENDPSKSFHLDDLQFFMEFPNIQIYYEPRLHAKYYMNDNSAVLTSMNLYDYSQNNNIETGVLMKASRLGISDLDYDAFEHFEKVIKNSKTIFEKVPEYEKQNLGFSKKYTGSKIIKDITSEYFNIPVEIGETVPVSQPAINTTAVEKPSAPTATKPGFCIRTGVAIPYNPKRPFCDDAYKSWVKFQDENYKEKFCHFSGEPSNGETSFSKPILKKNWKDFLSLQNA